MDRVDVVTLSEIEHYTYCPRQWALGHLDGVWTDNEFTALGHIVHKRVDIPEQRLERGHTVIRGATLWSDDHALFGRADVLEFRPGHPPFPVEHKSGDRALRPTTLQLAAQALCLQEMLGEEVLRGAVWLHGQRRRKEVELTAELKSLALRTAERIRESRLAAGLPRAVFDNRCPPCALINECLPRLVSNRRRALALHRSLFDPGPRPQQDRGDA